MEDFKELKQLETDDYQNKKGNPPKSNVPVSIEFCKNKDGVQLDFDFKNTSELEVKDWFKSSKEALIVNKFKSEFNIKVDAYQDGDYPNDWVKLVVKLIEKLPPVAKVTTPVVETTKLDDKKNLTNETFSYTYVLSCATQTKEINLVDYKTSLEKIIKEYLGSRLISLVIDKNSYTLTLNNNYETGDKRRLGRLISQNSGLKQYVRKISYNNAKDVSGQLFVIKKNKKNENGEVKPDVTK